MIYNIIALSVVVVFLGAIIFILAKKFTRLKALDVDTIKEEKEARVRDRILMDRMKRKAETGKALFKRVVGHPGRKVKGVGSRLFQKLVDLEKKYQKESNSKAIRNDISTDARLSKILAEAEDNSKKGATAEAEKQFIEVISLDPKNIRAYTGLGHLYLELKEYEQALQTFEYLVKLNQKNSHTVTRKNDMGIEEQTVDNSDVINENFIHIGEVYAAMGKHDKAFEYFSRALAYIPNDPKTLDLLIQTAIIMRDKLNALEYTGRLADVNPDNQKISEYKKRISEI